MNELKKGITLIEASAGTGKTYRLCRIALQLTLQHGITLDRILAVTFTEAATEELAARLQSLYQDCLRQLDTGNHSEETLIACAQSEGFDEARAANALRYSLEVFDEAPISTIHSFCKRSLELVALETQTPLDAELNQVENDLIERLQDEYIRQNILERSTALSLALSAKKRFAEGLSAVGKQTAAHPEAQLQPKPKEVSIESLEAIFEELPSELGALQANAKTYEAGLDKRKEPYKQLFGKKPDLAKLLSRGVLLNTDFEWLQKLNTEAWLAGSKAKASHPPPPVCSRIDALFAQIDDAFLALTFHYRTWLFERLERAKQNANSISFNDLLHLLDRALTGPAGERVQSILASRYDAALIDEFQDTDRTQLNIAKTLFGSGDHYLFYIGDPKQAIYRFRGADIYAYFKAVSAGIIQKEVLPKNFRSAPRLVEAVNLLFQNSTTQFVDPRIEFTPVEPGRLDSEFEYRGPALRFLQPQLSDPSAPRSKGDYQNWLSQRAAEDLSRRLNEDPDFHPGDVTFLVNNRFEAATLQDALLERGISAAIRADRSIFQTAEALEIKQLLATLSAPTRASLKRATFAVLHGNIKATSLVGTAVDEALSPFFSYISEWARDWFDRNFDVNMHQLLELVSHFKEGANSLDDERRYANYCQLAELLSEAQKAEELSARGLYNWLCRCEQEDVSSKDEWQTRISSDEEKPQILTVHKSKGLQFPVVILPFLSLKRIRLEETASAYHDSEDNLIIDLAGNEDSESVRLARRESLSEDVRLLYVAMTRAEMETLVYLCPEEMKRTRYATTGSSFAQFLLGERIDADHSSLQLGQRLEQLASESGESIGFEQCLFEDAIGLTSYHAAQSTNEAIVSSIPLHQRQRLPRAAKVLSFSALNRGLHTNNETDNLEIEESDELSQSADETDPLAIEGEEEPVGSELSLSIFTLPKGRHAGDLLHLILERYDFSRPETLASTTQLAFENLQFEPRDFEPIVAAQIETIATIPLKSAYSAFCLRNVSPEKRVPELEFSYPVFGDVQQAIAKALASAPLGEIPKEWASGMVHADACVVASMLRGFIDLIAEHEGRFYIFDWKSNYLGQSPADYDAEAMKASMSEHNYFLQYLLYCIALKRFLQWRYPNEDYYDRFGGVFYLYARGISPNKQTGIYYDLPSTDLIEALDSALLEGALA